MRRARLAVADAEADADRHADLLRICGMRRATSSRSSCRHRSRPSAKRSRCSRCRASRDLAEALLGRCRRQQEDRIDAAARTSARGKSRALLGRIVDHQHAVDPASRAAAKRSMPIASIGLA
jgi:hypothetical protein